MFRANFFVPYLGLLVLFLVTLEPAVAQDIEKSPIDQDNSLNQNLRASKFNQQEQYQQTKIIQCKVEISRIVFFCGLHSHASIINYATYVRAITHDQCQLAHQNGRISIGDEVISNLLVNGTVSASIVMAGSISKDGACTSGAFSDPYGSWPSVAVTGNVNVTLKSGSVYADVESNTIYLPSGVRCHLSMKQCIDIDGSSTFWY